MFKQNRPEMDSKFQKILKHSISSELPLPIVMKNSLVEEKEENADQIESIDMQPIKLSSTSQKDSEDRGLVEGGINEL